MKTPDFFIRDCVSVIQLIPTNEEAKKWISNNLSLDGSNDPASPIIEARYFYDICEGFINDGLTANRIFVDNQTIKK